MLNRIRHVNPSGSTETKESIHAQSIGAENCNAEYNAPKSHRDPTPKGRVMRYAELAGNCKNRRIKNQRDNKLYHALLTPQQRFGSEDMAKAGFKSLMYSNAPVIVDASAPSGDMIFLNMEYLDLYPHKDENFRLTPFQSPINQNIRTSKVYWMGAMAASNARRFGLLGAITA